MLSRRACTPWASAAEIVVSVTSAWRAQYDRRLTVPWAWKRARRYAAWASRPLRKMFAGTTWSALERSRPYLSTKGRSGSPYRRIRWMSSPGVRVSIERTW